MTAVDIFQGQGFVTALPGVYVSPKFDAGEAQRVLTGILAMTSGTSFCRLKPGIVHAVSTPSALARAVPAFAKRYRRTIYSPMKDSNVPGRPSLVYLVNAAPSTRAEKTIDNGDGDALTIKSRIYGADGNQIWFKVQAGTAKGSKFTLYADGQTYVLDNIGGENILGVHYDDDEATTMDVTIDETGVVIGFTKLNALNDVPTDTYNPNDMAFDGPLTVDLDVAAGGAGITFTVTGINKTTGLADTENIVYTDVQSGERTTTKSWSAITSIARTAGAWGTASQLDISGNAFDLPVEEYPTLQSVIDRINGFTAQGFAAEDAFGDALTRLVTSLDHVSDQDIIDPSPVYFKAQLDQLVRALGNDESDPAVEPLWSPYIIAERPSGATGLPTVTTDPQYLGGGANGTPTSDTWTTALTALRPYHWNEGWGETTDASIEALVTDELNYRRGQGGKPTHWHFGQTSASPTKATCKAKRVVLNREDVHLWSNAVKDYDEAGQVRTFAPLYVALRMAAAYCGTSHLAMPLSWKYLNVVDIVEGSDWTAIDDADELIQANLPIFEAVPGQGFRVVRDVTTYSKSANAILVNGSSVRAMDGAIAEIKARLETAVALPNFDGSDAALRTQTERGLRFVRDDLRYITGWSDLSFERIGTILRVIVVLLPVLPTNFVDFQPTLSIPAAFEVPLAA